MNDNVKIKTLKVGDLVIWLPDGDIGVVVELDEVEVANQHADPYVDGYEPYHIQWFVDADSSGWHDYNSMLELLSSV